MAKRSRSAIGRRNREAGKEFERDFATYLRERYPGLDVRRASQAERAMNPDVFCLAGLNQSHPMLLNRIWWELTRGLKVTPAVVAGKMFQADRDTLRINMELPGPGWVPVVVWNHRRARRESNVTTYLRTLTWLMGLGDRNPRTKEHPLWGVNPLVTIGLDAFLVLIERHEATLRAESQLKPQ